MNAYELADILEEYYEDFDGWFPALGKSIDMLRQQADEIKELHKIAQVMALKESDARKSLHNSKDRIAELEQTIKAYAIRPRGKSDIQPFADVISQQADRIAELEKAIESALGWVQAWDREKPYTDIDLCGEMVSIRLTGLCVLATVIGKRNVDKLLEEFIASTKVMPKEFADEVDKALGIDRTTPQTKPLNWIYDNGVWTACTNQEKVFVESSDFHHDVRLYIDGDFVDLPQKFAYAEEIAKRLNIKATTQTKPLSDEEIDQLTFLAMETIDMWGEPMEQFNPVKFARAIEERHGIK